MKVRRLKYALVYTTPLIVLLSIYSENYWSFSAVLVLFVLIPFLELFTKGSTKNLEKIEEDIAKEDKIYDWLIYGLVPLQYIILFYFLYQVSNEHLSLHFKLGATIAFGMACGILGICQVLGTVASF